MTGRPEVVVSDIDGTLINSDERVTARTSALISKMASCGTELILATGRPARWIWPVIDQLPLKPRCLAANGAVAYDSATDTILWQETLAAGEVAWLIEEITAVIAPLGTVGFSVERATTTARVADTEVFFIEPNFIPTWPDSLHTVVPLAELAAVPVLKLMVRCPHLTSAQMLELLTPAIPANRAKMTFSIGEGLLEISAPGISKAGGLAKICQVDPARIVAFGDMPNDIELLTYAGRGVAMGNAHPLVLAAAPYTTATNDEDGLAQFLEPFYL